MTEKKVLFIVESSVPYGANRSLINLIDFLLSINWVCHVVMSYEGELCTWLEQRNVGYAIIRHRLTTYPKSRSMKDYVTYIPKLLLYILTNITAYLRLLMLTKRLKPDIIHTNIGPCQIGYFVSKRTSIPHVWHLREYQDLDFGMKPFPSKNLFVKRLNDSDAVITITKDISKHFSLKGRNLHIIYNGVMWRKDVPQIDFNKCNHLLFVGRIEEAKGIELLVDAFSVFVEKSGNESLQVFVAGTGEPWYEEYIKEKVKSYNLESRFKFLGFREDRLELMKYTKALIVPSRHEGFGLITAEAMLNGCFVIGNGTGGTREIIANTDGDLGILFDKTATQLADAIDNLINMDKKRYEQAIVRAQSHAADSFTIEKYAGAIVEVYKSVL